MIAALGLLACAQAPAIVEAIVPGARFVCVQALAPVPELGPRATVAVRLLAGTMARETRDFTRGTLLAYSLPGGDPIRTFLTEDSICVQVTVPEGQLELAAALLESVVRRPSLDPSVLEVERSRLALASPDSSWIGLLRGKALDFARVRAGDAEEMRQTLFRPERVVFAASGGFRAGQAREALEKRFAGWTEPSLRGPIPEADAPEQVLGGKTWLYLLSAPEFGARDVALPTRLLATLALGTGKGSSMHRVIRERWGLSYRQEALWLPTPTGFAPTLAFVHASEGPADPKQLWAERRSDLLDDVKSWTEAHRQRALGMASLVWRSGLPLSPLYLRPSGPPGESLQDQTFLAGYWPMKTGQPWDPERLQELLALVRLEDMREAAIAMVRDARPRIVNRR